MAREVRSFDPTIPAGTAVAAPVTIDLAMPARTVRWVRIRIPPGPAGVMGFALAASGISIIPFGAGQWVIGDDEVLEWPLEGQIDSGAWQLRGYNTGVYAHTLHLTFGLDPVTSPGTFGRLAQPLSLEA